MHLPFAIKNFLIIYLIPKITCEIVFIFNKIHLLKFNFELKYLSYLHPLFKKKINFQLIGSETYSSNPNNSAVFPKSNDLSVKYQ